MRLDFLPQHIYRLLEKLGLDGVYEIRLRVGYPIKLTIFGDSCYLTQNINGKDEKILCTKSDIDHVINVVTEKSLYAFNDRIKEGYITTTDGIRIGVSGECVFSNGQIVTIKNFSSLNIRIPRQVVGCANVVYNHIFNGTQVLNTLIISSAGYGKTTILKDLIRLLNNKDNINMLVIDERGEFYEIGGENVDAIRYSDKLYAFNCALRSMSPDVVITDELVSANDWSCVNQVVNSGVKIIASCHASSLTELKSKSYFNKNIFDRYVLLHNHSKAGRINFIADKEFNVL